MTLATLIWYGARICLVAMFPFSALDKIWHWRASLAQTQSSGLPGGRIMLVAAILVEATTPVMIVTGWYDRLGALLLAGFCVITAFLYHPFWRGPDFFSPTGESKAREHFWQFLKNFGLVGGLLLVAFAGTLVEPRSLASLSSDSWSSTPCFDQADLRFVGLLSANRPGRNACRGRRGTRLGMAYGFLSVSGEPNRAR